MAHLWRVLFLFLSLRVRVKVSGRHNIPSKGPLVIAANHRTFYDPVLVTAAIGLPVAWVSSVLVSEFPMARGLAKRLGTIFVDHRGRTCRGDVDRILETSRTKVIGFFPEGIEGVVHIRRRENLCHFKRGFAYTAVANEIPVLPVAIIPHDEAVVQYPFGPSVRRIFLKRSEFLRTPSRMTYSKVELRILPPVPVGRSDPARRNSDILLLRERVKDSITKALKESLQYEDQVSSV